MLVVNQHLVLKRGGVRGLRCDVFRSDQRDRVSVRSCKRAGKESSGTAVHICQSWFGEDSQDGLSTLKR